MMIIPAKQTIYKSHKIVDYFTFLLGGGTGLAGIDYFTFQIQSYENEIHPPTPVPLSLSRLFT